MKTDELGSLDLESSPEPLEPVTWGPPDVRSPHVPPPAAAATGPLRPLRWRGVVAATVLVGAIAGGAAGYAGARIVDDASPSTTAAPAGTSLAFASTLDVASVLRAVEPSVVSITTTISQRIGRLTQTGEGAGTGIIVSADGSIITNAHVIDGATEIRVTLPGETVERVASVVKADTTADVALLKVSGVGNLTPATLGSANDVKVGDDVVAIGNALALEGEMTVTRGIVSAMDRSIETSRGSLSHLIQTDAAISSGNSGGPLVNARGQVIGINTAGAVSSGSVNAENIGFAIPVAEALRALGLSARDS
ncbi:MAG TPA: trypsin-like peptidase domain-containing protein [Acidimicrobiales bacterium]